MRWKSIAPVLALFFIGVALPARSQVTYSAEEGKLPFTVGVGISDIWLDWGITHPKMAGITLWADWRLARVPAPIRGLGIEFEGRDVNWATPSHLPGHRMDTALAGPMYEWRRSGRVRPFGKFLMGIGSIDYPSPGAIQNHDTLTVFAPAGGSNVRLWRELSVRGEYEWQYWQHFLGPNDLTPHGFSIGAVYDFGRRATD
jgi:hypothetical protein